eukprot:tig00020956_g16524.t1
MAGKTLDWVGWGGSRPWRCDAGDAEGLVAGAQAAGLRRVEDSWRALVIERRRECVGLVEEAEEAFGLPPRKWRRWPHGRSALTDLGPRAIRTQARQPSLGPVAPPPPALSHAPCAPAPARRRRPLRPWQSRRAASIRPWAERPRGAPPTPLTSGCSASRRRRRPGAAAGRLATAPSSGTLGLQISV